MQRRWWRGEQTIFVHICMEARWRFLLQCSFIHLSLSQVSLTTQHLPLPLQVVLHNKNEYLKIISSGMTATGSSKIFSRILIEVDAFMPMLCISQANWEYIEFGLPQYPKPTPPPLPYQRQHLCSARLCNRISMKLWKSIAFLCKSQRPFFNPFILLLTTKINFNYLQHKGNFFISPSCTHHQLQIWCQTIRIAKPTLCLISLPCLLNTA